MNNIDVAPTAFEILLTDDLIDATAGLCFFIS
jgi:hypothetical protein